MTPLRSKKKNNFFLVQKYKSKSWIPSYKQLYYKTNFQQSNLRKARFRMYIMNSIKLKNKKNLFHSWDVFMMLMFCILHSIVLFQTKNMIDIQLHIIKIQYMRRTICSFKYAEYSMFRRLCSENMVFHLRERNIVRVKIFNSRIQSR